MAWTTPGTAVSNTPLTASFWNTNVRDQMTEVAPIMTAWTTYSPTVAQGGSTNISKTVTYSKYVRVGKFVYWQFRLDMSGAGTGGNGVTLTVPVNPATASVVGFGNGVIADASTSTSYHGMWINISNLLYFIGDWSGVNTWGSVPNIALASGDSIYGSVFYEVA